MADRFYEWTTAALKRYKAFRRKFEGLTFSGNVKVTQMPGGMSVHVPFTEVVRTAAKDRTVLVKITDPESGGGKYAGYILRAPTTVAAATGNLTEDEIGSTTDATACLILNTREVGKSTHDIESGYLPLIFLGRLVGATAEGKPIVAIDGMQWEDCE